MLSVPMTLNLKLKKETVRTVYRKYVKIKDTERLKVKKILNYANYYQKTVGTLKLTIVTL